MKLYCIVGEASGDLHAANLIRALKASQPDIDIRAMGGDKMQEAGATLGLHYGRADFVGFVEVVRNLPLILRMFRIVEQDILNYKPDAVILVDYPGFNLRMAKFLHKNGIRVFYYISPQVWAWKSGRVNQIKKYVEAMFCILPFEEAFYNRWQYKVHYVGHPLLDALAQVENTPNTLKEDARLSGKPIIALLPGSRQHEINIKLPVMLQATQHLANQYELVIAGAPNQKKEFYAPFLKSYPVKLVHARTYDLLRISHAALVTSGTATLETALWGVPQAVCYKGSYISYFIAKALVKNIQYISLVNLIMDKLVVKEYIQHEMNVANLKKEIDLLVAPGVYRNNILNSYQEMRHKLGDGGASQRTAHLILAQLQSK